MALSRAITQPSAAALRDAARPIPPQSYTRPDMTVMPGSRIHVSD